MVSIFSLTTLLLVSSCQAFVPALQLSSRKIASECVDRDQQQSRAFIGTRLSAADGAPQYEKIDAILQEAEKVAEGSYMLHVKVTNTSNNNNNNNKVGIIMEQYQPGHVLALEIEDTSGDLNADAKQNGGWMRGPYTVSRATKTSLDIMVRVVGKKSKAFAESKPGTPVRFGGKFKVPILEGISKEKVQKAVFISTGVGIGPCLGAIELAMGDESFPPIALVASFRELTDIAFGDHLDEIARQNPSRFEWKPVVTSKTGRISKSQDTMKAVTECIQDSAISETHFHLIGNGQLINEFREGLGNAGVPEDRITVEQYFNHKAESSTGVIETISSSIIASNALQQL